MCVQEQQGPPSEERGHGTVSLKTYYKYFRAGGNFLFLTITFILLFVAEVSAVCAYSMTKLYNKTKGGLKRTQLKSILP